MLAHGGGADEVSVAGTPLLWAASVENLEGAKLLLEMGTDPTGQDSDGLTALFLAATVGMFSGTSLGNNSLLLYLNQSSCAAESHPVCGRAPGNVELVQLLLDAGADANANAHGQMTPLHTAAETGRKEIVSLLLEVLFVFLPVKERTEIGA